MYMPLADPSQPGPYGLQPTAPDTRPIQVRIMSDLMRDYGLTAAQAAGIVGNLSHESNNFRDMQEIGQPSGRGGYGWAQWTNSGGANRRTAFFDFAKANGLDPNSYEANYRFLTEGEPNEWGPALNAVRRANTASDAMMAFERKYERAGVKAYNSRQAYTQQALGMYSGDVPAGARGSGPILRKGARGDAVASLQSDLAAKGFDPGPVDGIFGNKTRGAVRAFQASAGLNPDGVVGPLTYGQLTPPVTAVADEGPASPMGTVRIPIEAPPAAPVPMPSPDTIQGGAGTGSLAGGTNPPRVPEPYERMETAVGWLPQFPQPYDIPQQASPAASPAPATPPKPAQAPIPYNNDTLNRTLSGLPPTALQKIETVRQAAQQAGLPYIDIDLNSVIPRQQASAPAPLAPKPVQVASNDYQMPMGVSTASLGIGSPNSGLSIGPAPGAAGPSATDLGIAAAGGYPPSSVIRPPPIAQPAPPLQQQVQAAPPSSSVIPQGGGIASAQPVQFGANRGTGGILGLLAGRGKNPASLIPTSSGSGPYGDDQVNSWVRGPTNALGGSEGLHWTGSNGRPVTAVENNWGSGYFTSYG
mgnify:CR=1 FL=1